MRGPGRGGVEAVRGGLARLRASRGAVVVLVYAALVLDNMLLTVLVPIIPDYLYQLEHRSVDDSNTMTNTTFISNLSTTPSPSVTAATTSRPPHTSSSSADMEGKEVSQEPFTSTPGMGPRRELINEGRSVASSVYSPFSVLQKPRVGGEGDRRDNHSSIVGSGNFAANDLTHSKAHRTPQKYWRFLPVAHPFPFVNDVLRRRLTETSDTAFDKPESEQRTLDQKTGRGGSLRRFAKGKQTLNGVSPETLVTQNRVLPSWSPQAPKEAQDPQENKPSASSTPSRKREIFEDISSENWKVGLLLSSKALVQLMVNPMVGLLTSHIGYSLPLVFGTHNLLLSAILFASAQDFTLMFLGRSLQGVASACIAVSGMGIIAERYTDDAERGRVQGIVLGGIALGVLAGYPLGSLLYDFTGSKTPPFLLVAVLTAVLAVVQMVVLNPRSTPERPVMVTPLSQLVRDPYVVVTAGAVMVATSTLAVLEPCLPIWLTDNLHLQKWQLGVVFIPDSVGYFLGTSCTAGPSYRLGRWRAALLAMMLVALAAATVPEAGSLLELAGPHLGLGVGVGTVDAALMPLLAAVVDARHVAAYGAVYAIAQAAVALAYFLGPLVGSAVVQVIGFPWLMRSMALLNLCYCPVLCFLNTLEPTTPSETQAVLMAAPQPRDYLSHITTVVQPRQSSSVTYQQLFDEDED
ncbi:synaptic vesicular amine transporter-like [Eriocheir sinensis]|uniref:synaptic vesicular amine transporter-like n=1 Tax=Eriocheir sinensis TaxID=95602 RepID=UPI0021C63E91|nr:synaptic vesicular amine transporter-like [Eriocheir sinensis]XP_050697240.1 synaptic vesicular amine transporter-like [Eriocheir sinensis]XP_050697249.1 synaptic vesicular amine transporter-like [Eriocheir sinensis]